MSETAQCSWALWEAPLIWRTFEVIWPLAFYCQPIWFHVFHRIRVLKLLVQKLAMGIQFKHLLLAFYLVHYPKRNCQFQVVNCSLMAPLEQCYQLNELKIFVIQISNFAFVLDYRRSISIFLIFLEILDLLKVSQNVLKRLYFSYHCYHRLLKYLVPFLSFTERLHHNLVISLVMRNLFETNA